MVSRLSGAQMRSQRIITLKLLPPLDCNAKAGGKLKNAAETARQQKIKSGNLPPHTRPFTASPSRSFFVRFLATSPWYQQFSCNINFKFSFYGNFSVVNTCLNIHDHSLELFPSSSSSSTTFPLFRRLRISSKHLRIFLASIGWIDMKSIIMLHFMAFWDSLCSRCHVPSPFSSSDYCSRCCNNKNLNYSNEVFYFAESF